MKCTAANERFGVIGGVCPQKHLCVFASSPPASTFVSRQPRQAATTLYAIWEQCVVQERFTRIFDRTTEN